MAVGEFLVGQKTRATWARRRVTERAQCPFLQGLVVVGMLSPQWAREHGCEGCRLFLRDR